MNAGNIASYPGRINRYIMECKCSTRSGSGDADSELIDTLWNVNSVVESVDSVTITELMKSLILQLCGGE